MVNVSESVNGVVRPVSDADQAIYDARQAAWAAASQSRLLAALAQHRYVIQTSGMTIGGVSVSTDDVSVGKLTAAWIKAQNDPTLSITWITSGNAPVVLNATTITAIGDAVFAFQQKCYAVQGNLITNVGQYTTAAALVAAFDAGMAA